MTEPRKREKTHREKKNWRARSMHAEQNQARNAKRPKQRFLGIDTQTGMGLGWTREAA